MELETLTLLETLDQDDIQMTLRDTLSTIYLGDVIDIWQDQRQICVGSHADFAKHLLAVHREYCLDYCRAESQKKAAVLSLCVDSQCTHQENYCKLFQSMELSHQDDQEILSGFGQCLLDVVPEKLHNQKESDDAIEDQNWENSEGDHDTQQDEETNQTSEAMQEADEVDAKPHVRFNKANRRKSNTITDKYQKSIVGSGEDMKFSQLDSLNGHTTAMPSLATGDPATIKVEVDTQDINKSPKTTHVGRYPYMEQEQSRVDHPKTHMMDDTSEKPHDWSDFDTEVNQLSHLKSHAGTPTRDNRLVCPECGKQFKHTGSLRIHLIDHTGEKPHVCSECGKGFNVLSRLKTHIMTHTGEKPHVCSECGKRFIRPCILKCHMMTHTGEKPHVCSVCDKGFSRPSMLKSHMMTHTGGKDHVCTVCSKGFSKTRHLKKHMLSHTDKKAHMCSDCGRGFNVISCLKSHLMTHKRDKSQLRSKRGKRLKLNVVKTNMSTHTGEKPHVCSECGKGFSIRTRLKAHKMTHRKI